MFFPPNNTLQRKHYRHLSGLCVLALFFFFTLGCRETKGPFPPSKQALYFKVQAFNKFIRWRAYERAKPLVESSKRSEHFLLWEKERPFLKITDMQIRDVTFQKKGYEALVMIVMNCYRLPSASLQRVVYQQKWTVQKGSWFYNGEKQKGLGACTPSKK